MKPPPPSPPDVGEIRELIDQWSSFATDLARKNYTFDLDNWLNDVDVRELILEALPMYDADDLGDLALRLEQADSIFKAATRPFRGCVWGKGTARKERWTAEKNWWYFRAPLVSNAQLEDELATIR